jgi:hypothetical protein
MFEQARQVMDEAELEALGDRMATRKAELTSAGSGGPKLER